MKNFKGDEMTQEEKARAYDEALKHAKFYHGNCPSEPERKKLEEMFPVLHESEDERIRKELKEAFEAYDIESTWNGIPIRSIFAWLEKQKEQKPAEWSDTNELVFKDICKHLKEEGYNGWIVLLNALRNGEFQPKPEWSEEDKNKIERLAFLVSVVEEKEMISPSESIDLRNFIKSLRPQSSWKPSEWQMSMLLAVINEPNNAGSESCHLALKSIYDDLKKLT